MEKIKKLLIILLVLIVVIIFIIIILINKNQNGDQLVIDDEVAQQNEDIHKDSSNQNMQNLDDIFDFLLVNNCIQEFIDALNVNNYIYYQDNEDDSDNIKNDKIKNSILEYLDKDFIQVNNINLNNIFEFIDKNDEKVVFTPLKIKFLKNDIIKRYLVYGFECKNEDFSFIKEDYFIVDIDSENQTFSIKPVLEKVNDFDSIKISEINVNKVIEINNSNQYNTFDFTNEDIMNYYMDFYKKTAISFPRYLYNNFMDNEYKQKRFENFENFEKYIKNNKDNIYKTNCKKFLVNEEEDGNNQFVGKDQYNNIYIFDSHTILDFKIKLDTYTLETEKFKQKYETATNEERVQMNIDKFFQMMNRQDYQTSYKYVNSEFKKNNCNTQEKFEQLIKNKVFDYNTLEINNIEKEGDYYVCKTQLTNKENEEEIKELTFFIKLDEGTNFEISFAI